MIPVTLRSVVVMVVTIVVVMPVVAMVVVAVRCHDNERMRPWPCDVQRTGDQQLLAETELLSKRIQ